MAELKHVWLVRTPSLVSPAEFISDPALRKWDGSLDMDNAIAQFCDLDGHSVDTMVSIITGMQSREDIWERENIKIYTDKGSALKDAFRRLTRFIGLGKG